MPDIPLNRHDFPTTFTLETALACNLHCPECAIGGGAIQREKGFLSFEQYRIIAEKIRPFCEYLLLHMWGEPMLNREILAMIRHASRFSRVNISTNGLNLTPDLAEDLITSGVAEIIVSIDGVTQEVYEQYRVGGDVETALSALQRLQSLNLGNGAKVQIIPQFIAFKHNQREMALFGRICADMGLSASYKAPYIRNTDSAFAYSDKPHLQRPHYPDVDSLKTAMKGCPNPQKVFTILIDGSVIACCHDYSGVTTFGNIFEQDVMDIWNSSSFSNFRQSILSGNAPGFCIDNCLSYFLSANSIEKTMCQENEPAGKTQLALEQGPFLKVNLCSGPVRLKGYLNIDLAPGADLILDIEQDFLPIPDASVETLVCISAINYFSRDRAREIIQDVYRVLKPGGITRFATQDLRILARHYLDNNREFYFQKLPDGRERFPGETIADKFNAFFYGFPSGGGKHCKYVYDFETLKRLFADAGFSQIEQKGYRESRIAEIELIDNRPEQMFFLEAVKKVPDSPANDKRASGSQQNGMRQPRNAENPAIPEWEQFRNSAFALLDSGQDENGWQHLLKALELNPGDRQAVIKCAGILKNLNRFDELAKLYAHYLTHHHEDEEIRNKSAENNRWLQHTQKQPDEIAREQARLAQLNQRLNPILKDEEHLSACMQWLRRAQTINSGGGVSASYFMDSRRWEVDYPETTGYIIPTFLNYYRLTGDKQYRQWAMEMGDWEISIQAPEGGAGEAFGRYGLRPRVFNTSQVILGWAALYNETGLARYRSSACNAADWILSNQDADGKWTTGTYQGPKAYKSRVAWSLLELYKLTGEEKYRRAAELSIGWVLRQARNNGWFANNSLTEPGKPWTHLIGYVLVGLLEIYRLDNAEFDRSAVLRLLCNAAKGIAAFYLETKERAGSYYATLPGALDQNWLSTENWSCITGNAQLAFFLRRLMIYSGDSVLGRIADLLIDDIKQQHYLSGIDDPDIFGGLPGSYPVNGAYCTYMIPNWGVKFFADSLLQRLLVQDAQKYLG